MMKETEKNIENAVKKALETGRNANDNFQEDKLDKYGANSAEETREGDEMVHTNFPQDESAVIFTDLQGIRHRGVYRKSRGFVETSETELPREEESFFPEEDIAAWEYEPESPFE